MGLSQRSYTVSEQWADRLLHHVGLVAALIGVVVLLVLTARHHSAVAMVAIGLYAVGLVTMLVASMLANHNLSLTPPAWVERFDHAAIFLMIAGTYTPFALLALPGTWGTAFMVFVWGVGALGAALKLAGRLGYGPAIALYLIVGWSILPATGHLTAVMPASALGLLVAGGILYSVGIAAFTAERLPYHTVIWHASVLLAAGCHYVAVLTGVVLPSPVK